VTAEESVSDETQQTSSSDPLGNSPLWQKMEEGFSEAQKERMDMRLSAEEWKVIRNLLKRGASHLIDEKPMLFIYRPDVLVSLASVLAKMSVHIDEEVNSIGDGEDSDMEAESNGGAESVTP
jgi:hypothetical protein